jgi:hypothetical protein
LVDLAEIQAAYNMNFVDENRKGAVQVLNSHEYEINEFGGTILASKYCERGSGGVMCLLIEATPPYDEFRAWGDFEADSTDSNLGKLLSVLNENLSKLIGGAHVLDRTH